MSLQKRVFVVGGTGFLGYHAIQEFLKEGWNVTALGLPPAPPVDLFPANVKVILQNIALSSDDALINLMRGNDAVVFAAGMDDRITPKKPAYPKFHAANVEACARTLNLAQQAGIKRAVVLGSYYAHFDRLWPEMKLAEKHAYIRSRVEQERAANAIPILETCVLELPYIFGDTLGRKPLWYPLVKYIRSSRVLFYMKGGSACITAETVGQAVIGAIERGQAGKCYPIGDENLTWPELLTRLAAADGRRIKVLTLPTWLIKLGLYGLWLVHQIQGKESGLDSRYFASLQTAETFLDPLPSKQALGYETGGLDKAFQKTVKACKT